LSDDYLRLALLSENLLEAEVYVKARRTKNRIELLNALRRASLDFEYLCRTKMQFCNWDNGYPVSTSQMATERKLFFDHVFKLAGANTFSVNAFFRDQGFDFESKRSRVNVTIRHLAEDCARAVHLLEFQGRSRK